MFVVTTIFFSLSLSSLDDQQVALIPRSADRTDGEKEKEKKKKKKKKVDRIGRVAVLKQTHTHAHASARLSNGALANEHQSSTIWVRRNRKHHRPFIRIRRRVAIQRQLLVFRICPMMLLLLLLSPRPIVRFNCLSNLQ